MHEVKLHSEITRDTSQYFEWEFDARPDEKKRVSINSVGGSIIHSYPIFSRILKEGAETEIIGIAASASAWVALAGSYIKMADYALMMWHDAETDNDELKERFSDSVAEIISKRTGMDKAKVRDLMKKETWFTAYEAKELGLIDEIIVTQERTIEDAQNMSLDEVYNHFKLITNKQQNRMDHILKELGVTSEDGALEKVKNILSDSNKKGLEIEKLTNSLNTSKAEIEKLTNKINALEEAETARKKAMSLELVENAIKEGKFAEDQKTKWLKFADSDFDSTKEIIEGLSTVKNLSDFTEGDDGKEGKDTFKGKSIRERMEEIHNKAKN